MENRKQNGNLNGRTKFFNSCLSERKIKHPYLCAPGYLEAMHSKLSIFFIIIERIPTVPRREISLAKEEGKEEHKQKMMETSVKEEKVEEPFDDLLVMRGLEEDEIGKLSFSSLFVY